MRTRRAALAVSGGTLLSALAGCLGEPVEEDGTGVRVVATLFPFYDFARRVAADDDRVETLVPPEVQGHGWEPSADVQRRAHDADVFVYPGPGVQRWADAIVENLRTDSPDVVVVAASEGVDLLPASATGGGGETDPHFWLDPTLAARAVRNVRDGVLAADAGDRTAYRRSVEAYLDRLRDVDTAFSERLAARRTNVVVVAGHDAYRYMARRYGFEVVSPVGVAPDAVPDPRAIRRVQRVVAEHDLEYVLAPALESDRLAREIARETGTEVLPISPVAGQTSEWAASDWGYIEQMLRVNLPSLATALGAG